MLRISSYRDGPYVDREKEEKFFLNLLHQRPETILFIYGPKSSGKTTFIEYIAENILQKDKRFYVNYTNFRRYAISNYDSFLNIYFKPMQEENKPMLAKIKEKLKVAVSGLKGEVSIPEHGINFIISFNLYHAIIQRYIDPFELMIDIFRKLRQKGKIPILIIDEIQELQNIYINGELKQKHLLTEFFKLLIGLTKETHLAHTIVITSSSTFINDIYNHSKLTKASEFFLFDHFDYKTTEEWLQREGFTKKEIDLIWEYLGGCPYDIIQLLSHKRAYESEFNLKEYLIYQAENARGRIKLFITSEIDSDKEALFKKILENIMKNGYIENKNDKNFIAIVKKAIEHDILFLIAHKDKIVFNSHLMRKGAEIYLKNLEVLS